MRTGGAWHSDLSCRVRRRVMVTRGCGMWRCWVNCVVVAVAASCFVVVWVAMCRYAEMSGCAVVASVRWDSVGQIMALCNDLLAKKASIICSLMWLGTVSYTHLRAHETSAHL
eukprot:7896569-Alexandrium_andersonii.AAC.1